jgi:Putative peptidoglycan binding domain
MKNLKPGECRTLRLCSFEISKEILELRLLTRACLALICTLGLVFIGPAAAHAGGPKMQQQRALPHAVRVPAYHGRAGGAYNFNVPNMSTNRLALTGKPTGIGTQTGVQVLRPNTNQPYIRQLGSPALTRTPLQVVKPSPNAVTILPKDKSGGVMKQASPMTGASAKTRDGAARTALPPVGMPPPAVPMVPRMGHANVQTKNNSEPPRAAITMGSSQMQSSASSVGAGSGDAAASNGSIGIDPTGQFQQNRRIQGSDQWEGSNYQTFRNYRSEWHDRDWWRSHYSHIVFCAGGWYYWKAGYWYPAWGYDPEAHYVYDGPIYAYNDLPPDQVVANAQAALRPQGYYQAKPDGQLGPVTRGAIVNYQRDHGLYETSTIDQPTSQSLGMR